MDSGRFLLVNPPELTGPLFQLDKVATESLGKMKEASAKTRLTCRRATLILCATALGAYHLVAAQVMYPVPGGDAVVFMPPAINLKAGHGLTNSLWWFNPDPLGQDRFYEHPPLFQLVVSACMWKAETRNAFMVLAIFNVLTLGLYAVFLCTAKIGGKLIVSSRRFGLVVFSLFALAFLVFNSSEGRPEVLSTLLLSLAIGILAWSPQRRQVWCFGLLIGATAAIHPANGILIACLAVLALLLRGDLSLAIRDAFLAAVIALGLFWFLLSLGPYGLRQTVHALSTHGSFAYAAGDYGAFTFVLYYFKLAPWSGLYLIGISLLVGFCAVHLWRFTQGKATRWFGLAALFLTAFAFWFFTIRSPNKSYCLLMLSPAFAAGAIYLFKTSSAWRGRKLETAAVWASGIFCALFTTLLARDVALFVNYRSRGVSFFDAREAFRKLERSVAQPLVVSESFWVLVDHFERINYVDRGVGAGDVMVVQQSQRQSLTPPMIPCYRVASDHFIPYRPTLLGIPLGRTMPGYSFAVFERDPIQE